LLECVAGAGYVSGGDPIPGSSCFFSDPAQFRGSLLPCYCGSTPQAICITSGAANPSEVCGTEIITASGCNPAAFSCINAAASNPATALGDVLQLVNCQRAACSEECGIPFESE